MTWPEGLLLYCGMAAATTVLSVKLLAGHWRTYVRVQLYLLSLILTFDIAAENRNLWSFPQLVFLDVLGSPIENLLFTWATVHIFLPVYVGLSRLDNGDGSRPSR